jgi:ABC-type multidrug transport system ATPase subunit
MLHRLKEKGITIFVSTPYMDEASLCDRIALIQEGEVFSVNTPEALLAEYRHELYGVKSSNMYQLLLDLEKLDKLDAAYAFGEYHHAVVPPNGLSVDELAQHLKGIGHQEVVVQSIDPTIEDCFLDFMVNMKVA